MSFRTCLLAGATAFFIGCLVWAGLKAYAPSLSNASVSCDQRVYDFGTKPIGESFSHIFLLRNTGGQDLQIAEVRAGCSCATAELTDKTIKSGGTVPLKVIVSLKNLRGPVEQHFVVKSTDPSRTFLLLKTKGLVASEFSVQPRVIDFGNIVKEEELEGHVDIAATGAKPFRLLDVVCDSPQCRISQEAIEDGRHYRVSVRLPVKLPVGYWRTAVRIRTDNPLESQIAVPVVARVKSK